MKEFDECASIEHGCSHSCVNTLGGYECACDIGYELHSDGKKCESELLSRVPVVFNDNVTCPLAKHRALYYLVHYNSSRPVTTLLCKKVSK